MSSFVHLHVHTEYSLREGALRLGDYAKQVAAWEAPAAAITDTNALYGAVKFYKVMQSVGVKPIIGVQLTVARNEDAEQLKEGRPGGPLTDTAVLLAEDFDGYRNLVALVSLCQTRYRQPFVTFSELGKHCEKVIALIGGGESVILEKFSSGKAEEALRWLSLWSEAWPRTALYVDVQDHAIPHERQGLPSLVKWARHHEIPLVATNDVHYKDPEDADTQRVLAQLEGGHTHRLLEGNRYTLASEEEMERRFAKLPDALDNTLEVAARCNLEFPKDVLLPKYPTQTGESASVVLRRAAEAGLRQRYANIDDALVERLNYELSVIEKMGFADYFLVVADFIRYAHKHGISTGPGRGSAAGSLVSYALRITDVDPVKYNLLFERFLNPERVSWPDIDTDFEYERRSEVIQYVVERYGATHVAQIGTFGTLAARAALRDAGRVLQTDPKLVDRVAKLIPSMPGITLEEARKEVQGLNDLLASNPGAQKLWDVASGLEGFPRHTSIHAAGVVISPIPLSDLVPVQPGSEGTPVTQYTMEDVEQLGLIKMDFLGLKTLTLIDQSVSSIESRTGKRLDWRRVSDRDKATYEMLCRGETEGCFQLESSGIRRVLRDLKPSTFEDLIAVISLYRPGPMENIPVFISAKHGRSPIRYPHSDLEPILRDTYGVMVYQEQIMQIAARMAGFSLGQADLLRRAVGKKKRAVLDAERSRFVEGCVHNGYSDATANDVYDLIVRFADYGYNRSHAAAYAVLTFRTAYLRANHMPDFLASLLSMSIGSGDKLTLYERDARKHGIPILPPCVQRSAALYQVEGETSIRTGLLSIRNVGHGAVESILQARSERPFTSMADFLQRVNTRLCNRKAVESLLGAGALDTFIPAAVTPEAAVQILAEAYGEAEEQKQSKGLGLSFQEHKAEQKMMPLGEQSVLYVRYNAGEETANTLRQVKDILSGWPGETQVALFDNQKKRVRLLESRWNIAVNPELVGLLEEVVGIGNVKVGRMPAKRSKT